MQHDENLRPSPASRHLQHHKASVREGGRPRPSLTFWRIRIRSRDSTPTSSADAPHHIVLQLMGLAIGVNHLPEQPESTRSWPPARDRAADTLVKAGWRSMASRSAASPSPGCCRVRCPLPNRPARPLRAACCARGIAHAVSVHDMKHQRGRRDTRIVDWIRFALGLATGGEVLQEGQEFFRT